MMGRSSLLADRNLRYIYGARDLEAPPTIFFGGPVITINDQMPEAEAIAIRDGKIVAVGDRKKVFQFHTPHTRMVDLQGRALLPGFIEPHVHLAWSAFTKYRLIDVSPLMIRSKQELIAVVRAAANKKRAGEWALAFGYDPSWHAPDEPPLTACDLNQASTTVPIFVMGNSGDVAYLNDKAFEAARNTLQTKDQIGSLFVRDAEGCRAGEIRSTASLTIFFRLIPQTTFEQNLEDCTKLVEAWARQGCTTVYDTAVGALWRQEEVRLFLELASDPATPLRFRAALVPTEGLPHVASIKPMQGNERLCFLGIKFWADGPAPGITSPFAEPLLAHINRSNLNQDEHELQIKMREWHQAGWQLLVRAEGRKAVEQVLRVFEAILNESPRPGHRHRIEHCTLIEEAHLAIAKQLGLGISHYIGHLYWGKRLDDMLGERLARQIIPLASEFARGLPVSLHSDSPVTSVEPLRYVETAVTRALSDCAYTIEPDERITVDQALKAVTLHPAYQCFLDEKLGSLEVGKLADLVVLDRNPRAVSPTEISKIKVLETYLAGIPQPER